MLTDVFVEKLRLPGLTWNWESFNKAKGRNNYSVNWAGNWWGGSILAVTCRLDKKIPPEIRLWKWWLGWKGRDGKAREMAVKRKHQWGEYNKCLFAMWPWSRSLLSLFLSFLICTTESNRVVIRIQQISICSEVCDCTKRALKVLRKCSMLGLFPGQAWRRSQRWAALSVKVKTRWNLVLYTVCYMNEIMWEIEAYKEWNNNKRINTD